MIHYMTTERDWAQAITEAKSHETLRAVAAGWAPFANDAATVIDAMTADDFKRWRAGLALERSGTFAGEDFAREFGAILMPARLIDAALVAERCAVPLGCALIRMEEQGWWERSKSATKRRTNSRRV